MERDVLADNQKLWINCINPNKQDGAASGSKEQCPKHGYDG